MRTLPEFVSDALVADFPPANPLRKAHWAALAFDRNSYSDLAPSEIWDALLATHCSLCNESKIFVISAVDVALERLPAHISASRTDLMTYLQENFRFTSDHYILSPTQEWLCRLDQDVTLIAADSHFMRDVVNRCGGLDSIMGIMINDFDPDPSDSVGLRSYLHEITRGINEHPSGA